MQRQEGMKDKWKGVSIEIQVVNVVIVYDQGGSKYDRYAMSKMYANEGMERTTTCYSEYPVRWLCYN